MILLYAFFFTTTSYFLQYFILFFLFYFFNFNFYTQVEMLNKQLEKIYNLEYNYFFLFLFILIFFENICNTKFKKKLILFFIFFNFFFFESNCLFLYNESAINPKLLNGLFNYHPLIIYYCYTIFIVFAILQCKFILITKIARFNNKYFLLLFYFHNFKIKLTIYSLVGLILGSWWAYQEINWGGWWNWDPIELISLLFFILSFYLIHTVFSNITIFNFFFVYLIIFYQFFLTRYGIINSIHSFLSSNFTIFFIYIYYFWLYFFFFWILCFFKNKRSTRFVFYKDYVFFVGFFFIYLCYLNILQNTEIKLNFNVLLSFFFKLDYFKWFTFFFFIFLIFLSFNTKKLKNKLYCFTTAISFDTFFLLFIFSKVNKLTLFHFFLFFFTFIVTIKINNFVFFSNSETQQTIFLLFYSTEINFSFKIYFFFNYLNEFLKNYIAISVIFDSYNNFLNTTSATINFFSTFTNLNNNNTFFIFNNTYYTFFSYFLNNVFFFLSFIFLSSLCCSFRFKNIYDRF